MPFFLFVEQRIEKDVVWKLGEGKCRSGQARGARLLGDRSPAFRKDLRAQPQRAFPLVGSSHAAHFAKAASRFSFDPAEILLRSPWSNRASVDALAVLNQVNVERVETGRRFVGGLVTQFGESAVGQSDFLGLHWVIARIDHFGFNRKPFEISVPVTLFDDDADVNVVARPVNAALGEHERIEIFRYEHCSAPSMSNREKFSCRSSRLYGMKRYVVPVARHECDRRFLALDFSTDANVQWPLESVLAV